MLFRRLSALALLLLAPAALGQKAAPRPADELALSIFRELIEIDTTHEHGSTTRAAEAMARRLREAGFPDADIQIVGDVPERKNLVARLHGTGKRRPLLLLAHLDVVDALPSDWSFDPFKLTEKDGFLYGRGTTDDKDMAAGFTAAMIRMKKEGYRPDRDVILALTADEEGGQDNGVDWLIKHRRELIDAALCFNEGGGGDLKEGKRLAYKVQASEKVYQSYKLEVLNNGGHSSLPTRDNAIYHLAAGLTRLSAHAFPVQLSDVTRGYLAHMTGHESGQTAADLRALVDGKADAAALERLAGQPVYNAMMRTTCVATQLAGGHAENALPQKATAVVNCRLLPGDDPAAVQKTLVSVLADPAIKVTPTNNGFATPGSPVGAEVMEPVRHVISTMWPGVPIVTVMETGATDGAFLRRAGIPTYGVGLWGDMDDVRAHGKDERARPRDFLEGAEYLYRLARAASGGK